jgi:sensor domain CHASE-containing protein
MDSYHRVRKDQAGLHAVFAYDGTGKPTYAKRSESDLLKAAAGLIEVVRASTPLAHQVRIVVQCGCRSRLIKLSRR